MTTENNQRFLAIRYACLQELCRYWAEQQPDAILGSRPVCPSPIPVLLSVGLLESSIEGRPLPEYCISPTAIDMMTAAGYIMAVAVEGDGLMISPTDPYALVGIGYAAIGMVVPFDVDLSRLRIAGFVGKSADGQDTLTEAGAAVVAALLALVAICVTDDALTAFYTKRS